jgi:hypothetical protein
VAGPEYARLNTGVSITPGNSGNGALPTRASEHAENNGDAGQVTDARASRPLYGHDRLHTASYVGALQTHPVTTMRVDDQATGPAALPIVPTSSDYGEMRSVSVSV